MITYTIPFLRILSEVLTAAAAMAAFSMLLFLLQFIRKKQQLAWTFLPLLLCVAVIYSADALETMAAGDAARLVWQKIHWTGFVFFPSAALRFSLVLLELTGKKMKRAIRAVSGISAGVSLIFIALLWTNRLFTAIYVIPQIGTILEESPLIAFFWIFFALVMAGTFGFLASALVRTKTRASRRRMIYLIFGLVGIAAGSFPLLLFGSGQLLTRHPRIFWFLSVGGNALVTAMVLLMSYSVVNFSVPWSNRLTRLRMIEWMLRGPVTASVTLWVVTMINRGSGALGLNPYGINTLATVAGIIVLEYGIGLIMPRLERSSLVGLGRTESAIFNELQGMMVFRPELETYLEALTGALCDRFQARGGFFAAADEKENFDPVVKCGGDIRENIPEVLQNYDFQNPNGESPEDRLIWEGSRMLLPVYAQGDDLNLFLGVLGLEDINSRQPSEDDWNVLREALENARVVLLQRRYLTSAYQSLRMNAASQPDSLSFYSGSVLNQEALLPQESSAPAEEEVNVWTKDALTQYWGGPRLQENPLLKFRIVRERMAVEGEPAVNALRALLKKAAESFRPEGERLYTGEWTLYNIIDLKYFEKQKVKDVARRLAMSEADYYRKQKVAVEALAKVLMEMEAAANGKMEDSGGIKANESAVMQTDVNRGCNG